MLELERGAYSPGHGESSHPSTRPKHPPQAPANDPRRPRSQETGPAARIVPRMCNRIGSERKPQ